MDQRSPRLAERFCELPLDQTVAPGDERRRLSGTVLSLSTSQPAACLVCVHMHHVSDDEGDGLNQSRQEWSHPIPPGVRSGELAGCSVPAGGCVPPLLRRACRTLSLVPWCCRLTRLDCAADKLISRIDKADDNGDTALHYAAREGHGAVVTLLLRDGADALVQGKDGSPEDVHLCAAVAQQWQSSHELTSACVGGPR